MDAQKKKIVIIMVAVMFALLVPVSFFLFESPAANPVATDPVMQSTTLTTAPTTQPTTAPTTAPTTQPTTAPTTSSTSGTTKLPTTGTTKPSTGSTATKPTTPSIDPNGTFTITENGVGKAVVVISEKCTEKSLAAANDLLDYIYKISGAELDFQFDNVTMSSDKFYILVGPSKFTQKVGVSQPTGYPENEKLIVKRVNNALVLMGNDDGAFTGTQYAVTRFLEELGCGWFGTTALWQVVPNNPSITIEQMEIVETPRFIARGQNRLNEGRYKALAQRWYMGGVEVVVGGHYLASANVLNSHQSTHPEWYARYANGSQMYPADNKNAWPDVYWQYCYSSASFQQAVADMVISYFTNNPDCMVYTITPNDGWSFGTCECSGCARYSTDSALLLDFANAVARITKKTFPERYVDILAYHTILEAPSSAHPVDSNVEIMFSTETSMTKPTSTVGYIGMSGTKKNIPWKTNLENYISRTGVQQRAVWKWLCIAAESWAANWQYIPWVQGNVATNDLDFWQSKGVSFVFYDQGPASGYREYETSVALRWPLWYVANRGCWTQNVTGEELLADACKKLYGKGADAMLAYYMALANASASCTADSHAWAPPAANQVYTAEQIRIIDGKIANAEAMLGQVTEVERQRMENQIQLWKTAKTKI